VELGSAKPIPFAIQARHRTVTVIRPYSSYHCALMAGKLVKIFGVAKGKERREEKELRAKIAQQVCEDFWKAVNRKEDEHLMFATVEDLERIWKISRLEQLSKGLDWSSPELLERARTRFRKVLSTLVWIGWSEIGNLFLEHRNANRGLDRWDDTLPLLNTSFLQTEQLRTKFRNKQYIFAPIVIMEDDDKDDKTDYMQFSDTE
jgi:hypothetical protein